MAPPPGQVSVPFYGAWPSYFGLKEKGGREILESSTLLAQGTAKRV